jgi:hypothetical protein
MVEDGVGGLGVDLNDISLIWIALDTAIRELLWGVKD